MKKLYLLGFISTLHIALIAYASSTFLSQYAGEHLVGLLYTIGAILTLIIFGYSSLFIKKIGNKKLAYVAFLFNIVSLVILSNVHAKACLIIAFIITTITNNLVVFNFDILFEDLENPRSIGKMRGIYLTITNLAWVISPLFSGYIIENHGYPAIYAMSAVLAVICIGGLLASRMPDNFLHKKVPLLKTLLRIKNNERIYDVITLNFILQFFFTTMVVYTPIYLIKYIGFEWNSLGIIFTIMLLPFILFGLPIGQAIDRGWSEKKLLRIGIVITALATIVLSGITTTNIAIWAIVLFCTRVGASIIETATEVYLFKKIKASDTDILSVFRDMAPLAYLIAPIIVTIILYVLPFKSIFIILEILMLYGLRIVRKLK